MNDRVEKAPRKPKAQRGVVDRVPFRGFVDYPLSDAEREQIKVWDYGECQAFVDMERLIASGFTIRLVEDVRSGGFACQVYGSDKDAGCAGLALVGRGSTPYKAWRQFYWQHMAIQEDWSVLESGNSLGKQFND